MKLLASVVVWVLACVIAGLLIYRLIRRRPIVLRGRLGGRLGRRAIRIAAVAMVALGIAGAVIETSSPVARAQQAPEPPKADKPAAQDNGQAPAVVARPGPLRATEQRQAEPGPARTARFLEDYAKHLTEHAAHTGGAARFAQEVLYYEWANRLKPDNVRQTWIDNLRKHHADSPGLLAVMVDALRQQSNRQVPLAGPSYNADDIAKALDEIYMPARLHPALNAYLWGKLMALPTPENDEQAEAFALALYRVHRNARTLHAMIRAERATGVVSLFGALANENARAWMSKAGPTQAQADHMKRFHALTLTQAKKLAAVVEGYRQDEDAGAWDEEGLVLLSLAQGSADVQVVRPDAVASLSPAHASRITRLDLIRTGPQGGKLVCDWLGEITLPANATLRVIDLPALLTPAQTDRVKQAVDEVKTNATKAWELRAKQWKTAEDRALRESAESGLLLLERHLPLVYPALREAANAPPIGSAWPVYTMTPRGVREIYPLGEVAFDAAPGTEGLRLITQLYDESVFLSAQGVVEPYGYAPQLLTLDPAEPAQENERLRREDEGFGPPAGF